MTDHLHTPATPFTVQRGGRRLTLRELDPDQDAPLLHSWLTHPRSQYWDMLDSTVDSVAATYRAMAGSTRESAWLGLVDGEPMFFAETYDPRHQPLAEHLSVGADDIGMHLLVAPPTGNPIPGLTRDVMSTVLQFCFAHGAGRVVVEPDARNEAILAKNAGAGFVEVLHAQLPEKMAALSVCTLADFRAHGLMDDAGPAWERAERLITAKAIGEFAHELLINPTELGEGRYVLRTADADWEFTARRYLLDHWSVEPGSIRRLTGVEHQAPVTSSALILDLRQELGLEGTLLNTYLEELGSTVAHRVRTGAPGRPRSRELLNAAPHEVEAAMSEGHPCFVATNGRIGFNGNELLHYTPEAGVDLYPLWLAVPKEAAHLSHTAATGSEDELYRRILGESWFDELRSRMAARGLSTQTHRLMPVHPWQWTQRLRTLLAEDVAHGALVLLGADPDKHRPAQSIRTWTNVGSPDRPYVKMSLSVRNMGFVRGMSPKYMRATPAINDYVAHVVRNDAELRTCGFDVLTEFAAIGYTGDAFHRAGLAGPETKVLAALWRESPASRVSEDTRIMTMAALLHRDPEGTALVTELINASGLTAADWVAGYLRAYMRPIVHLLCTHRLAFIPHGENIILSLREHQVVGAFLKDIGEEVGLMDDGHGKKLPEEIERIRVRANSADIALGLFTDVFDGFLRFLAPILDQDSLLSEQDFWALVTDCLSDYAQENPDAAASLPLFAESFERSCLNRLQLRNPLEMVHLDDAVGSLIKTGELANPVALSVSAS